MIREIVAVDVDFFPIDDRKSFYNDNRFYAAVIISMKKI